MEEGIELAHVILTKTLGKNELFWEAKLLRHEIVGDFKILRKWKTIRRIGNNATMEDWHKTKWEDKADKKFIWKIKQRLMNGYKLKNIKTNNEIKLDFLTT